MGFHTDFINANQVDINEAGVYVSDRDSALHVVDVELDLSLRRVSTQNSSREMHRRLMSIKAIPS